MSRMDEIRERVEKAKPGPWSLEENDENPRAPVDVVSSPPEGFGWVIATDIVTTRDAEFIAHARTDVPYLLARCERLEAALRGLIDAQGDLGVHGGFVAAIARRALEDTEEQER